MYALILLQEDGLTWSEVLRDIPHDAPAIVMYLLTAICGWVIWKGSRGKPDQPDQPDQPSNYKEKEEAGRAGTGR